MYVLSDEEDMTSQMLKKILQEFKEKIIFDFIMFLMHLHNFSYFCVTSLYFLCIEMWAKKFRNFPHSNQEINASIESYHCYIKRHYFK